MRAETGAMLFGGYFFGMKKEAVVRESGATPEDGETGKSFAYIAPKPVEFIGDAWRESFNFNNRDELREVVLSREARDPGAYIGVREALSREGWTPVFSETDGGACDAIEKYRAGASAAIDMISEFEKAATEKGSGFSTCFFPLNFVEKLIKSRQKKTCYNALDKAKDDFVTLTLTDGESSLRLVFNAPVLSRKDALRYGEYIRR